MAQKYNGPLAQLETGEVKVFTSKNGGLYVSDHVAMFGDRFMFVSDQLPGPIRDQAQAYKDRVLALAKHSMLAAIRSDRMTLVHELEQRGLHDIAMVVRSIPVRVERPTAANSG